MALTEPFDLLTNFPGWITEFELLRRQERSRQAGGATIVKDMGPPLWHMVAQTKVLRTNELDYWRARLNSLENGLLTFIGYPLSRTYPILYPKGAWPTGASFSGLNANLSTINANRKAVALSALPAGYVVSVGDYISIGTRPDLHQAMESATANGSGVTPQFEVRPHLWPDVVTTTVVAVKKPSCRMSIIPDSVNAKTDLSGRGVLTFQALEAR